jgi:hypothetical protein
MTMSVGMLITENFSASSGFSSTFNFAITAEPSSSLPISSMTGDYILHGPHHAAQKSISTGLSELITTSSKLSLFKLMTDI